MALKFYAGKNNCSKLFLKRLKRYYTDRFKTRKCIMRLTNLCLKF